MFVISHVVMTTPKNNNSHKSNLLKLHHIFWVRYLSGDVSFYSKFSSQLSYNLHLFIILSRPYWFIGQIWPRRSVDDRHRTWCLPPVFCQARRPPFMMNRYTLFIHSVHVYIYVFMCSCVLSSCRKWWRFVSKQTLPELTVHRKIFSFRNSEKKSKKIWNLNLQKKCTEKDVQKFSSVSTCFIQINGSPWTSDHWTHWGGGTAVTVPLCAARVCWKYWLKMCIMIRVYHDAADWGSFCLSDLDIEFSACDCDLSMILAKEGERPTMSWRLTSSLFRISFSVCNLAISSLMDFFSWTRLARSDSRPPLCAFFLSLDNWADLLLASKRSL